MSYMTVFMEDAPAPPHHPAMPGLVWNRAKVKRAITQHWDQENDKVLKSALQSHFFFNVCFLLSAGEKETAPAKEEAESQPAWKIHNPASFKPLSTKLNNRYFNKCVNTSIKLASSMCFYEISGCIFSISYICYHGCIHCVLQIVQCPSVAPNRATAFLWSEEGKQCQKLYRLIKKY